MRLMPVLMPVVAVALFLASNAVALMEITFQQMVGHAQEEMRWGVISGHAVSSQGRVIVNNLVLYRTLLYIAVHSQHAH